MDSVAESIAYIVGSIAAVVIICMMLIFFAWLIAFGVAMMFIAALVYGVLRLFNVDVKSKIDELF